MKSTGILRKIDHLGRFVIPAEIRKVFGMDYKDDLEIYTDGDAIILKKYGNGCIFCGSADDLKSFRDKDICSKCAASISRS